MQERVVLHAAPILTAPLELRLPLGIALPVRSVPQAHLQLVGLHRPLLRGHLLELLTLLQRVSLLAQAGTKAARHLWPLGTPSWLLLLLGDSTDVGF
jgi:hypothetical protein